MKKKDGSYLNINEWPQIFEHIKIYGEWSLLYAKDGCFHNQEGYLLYSRLMARDLLEKLEIDLESDILSFTNRLEEESLHTNTYLEKLIKMDNLGIETIEFVPELPVIYDNQVWDVRGKLRKVYSDGKMECVNNTGALRSIQTKITGATWHLEVMNSFDDKARHMKLSTFNPDLSSLDKDEIDSYRLVNGSTNNSKSKKKRKRWY